MGAALGEPDSCNKKALIGAGKEVRCRSYDFCTTTVAGLSAAAGGDAGSLNAAAFRIALQAIST